MQEFFARVTQEREYQEREYQKSRDWKDSVNTAGTWVCYIVNYASRFMLLKSFDPVRYSFDNCMVKTAALCLAAWEWYQDQKPGTTDADTVPKAVQ